MNVYIDTEHVHTFTLSLTYPYHTHPRVPFQLPPSLSLLKFSFIVVFTVVTPWVPLLMLFLNVFDMRVRLVALLYSFRQPVPRRIRSIGQPLQWLKVVFATSLVLMPAMCLFSGVYFDAFFNCTARRPDFNIQVPPKGLYAFAILMSYAVYQNQTDAKNMWDHGGDRCKGHWLAANNRTDQMGGNISLPVPLPGGLLNASLALARGGNASLRPGGGAAGGAGVAGCQAVSSSLHQLGQTWMGCGDGGNATDSLSGLNLTHSQYDAQQWVYWNSCEASSGVQADAPLCSAVWVKAAFFAGVILAGLISYAVNMSMFGGKPHWVEIELRRRDYLSRKAELDRQVNKLD